MTSMKTDTQPLIANAAADTSAITALFAETVMSTGPPP